jgi:NitT/TauT family transport system permease protein
MTQTRPTSEVRSPVPGGHEPEVNRRLSGVRERPILAAIVSVGLAVVLLTLAEISAQQGWISKLIVPAPSDVYESLINGFGSGRYFVHIQATMVSALVGFVISAAVAIVVGGVLASIPFVERVLLPYVVAFQSLPKVAIAPVVIIWLGFEDSAKITIVVITCFFPIMINALQGFRIRQRDHLELLLMLGGTRWQLFRYIRLPSALPYVFSGLHIGIIFALIGAVVAEFISADSGLGYALTAAQGQFDVAGVFAILLILMVIGMVLNALMRWAERKLTFWAKDLTTTNV